jgi:hypothetical protein
MTPKELYEALAEDFSDGEFDGKVDDKPIKGASITPYSDFMASLDTYKSKSSGTELADKDLVDIAKSSLAAETIASGIVKFAPASSGLNVTSSGAVATLSYASKQYVYVAARNRGLVGFDITDPSNPIKIDLSTLNTEIKSTLNEVGGVVAVPGKKDPIVMVYDYSSQDVLFVDVSSQSIVKSIEVPVSATQSFSGGMAYISSGIADPVHSGVWLATTDGYWFVDTNTMQADSDVTVALANNQIITENIGADISQNMLFSPNYGAGYGGGLQIVDTNTKTAYALDNEAWSNAIGHLPGMYFADAGAVDNSYHIGVIMPEDANQLAFINLSDMDKYKFEITADGNHTFNAADGNISKLVSSFDMVGPAGGDSLELSNAAIDSETHLMLLSAGYSTAIGVAKLELPDKSGEWTPISKRAYYIGEYGEYSYARDPHAAGVVNSVTNHKSYGYILSDDGYVLQIDMQAFLDSEVQDSTGESSNSFALRETPFNDTNGSIKRLEIDSSSEE